jgi:hypothetical protein
MTVYEISLADASQPGLPAPIHFVTESEMTNNPAPAAISSTLNNSSKTNYFKFNPTNSVSANQPEKTLYVPDAMLEETEHIMEDYISLEQSNESEVAGHE